MPPQLIQIAAIIVIALNAMCAYFLMHEFLLKKRHQPWEVAEWEGVAVKLAFGMFMVNCLFALPYAIR